MSKKRKSKWKKFKLKLSLWLTFFVGITFAYFMWLLWKKLTEVMGDSIYVLAITGGIILIAIFTGYFSFNKIVKRFTK